MALLMPMGSRPASSPRIKEKGRTTPRRPPLPPSFLTLYALPLTHTIPPHLPIHTNHREKKKAAKQAAKTEEGTTTHTTTNGSSSSNSSSSAPSSSAPPPSPAAPQVEIEYVSADLESELTAAGDDPALDEFREIFKKFSTAEELCGTTTGEEEEEEEEGEEEEGKKKKKKAGAGGGIDDDSSDEEDDEDRGPRLSRKQRKKLTRLSVAELKQLVARPDVVEAHDVTSQDPKLLVHIKAYRNTVPVPRHWCHKRKYLTGKRGIEKAPFDLPEFIKATGIQKQREAMEEKLSLQTSRQKMRERVNPKMGRMDIDYAILEDAFLRYQTKPSLTSHGDLYYEGREFETHTKNYTPGQLSSALIDALGIPPFYPPPWLMNMQRYGPPPSYPALRIPGLNAPLPEKASFGMQPGGWGKPPVDEYGRPLYGDVFGVLGEGGMEGGMGGIGGGGGGEEVNRKHWGEVEYEEEEEEEEN